MEYNGSQSGGQNSQNNSSSRNQPPQFDININPSASTYDQSDLNQSSYHYYNSTQQPNPFYSATTSQSHPPPTLPTSINSSASRSPSPHLPPYRSSRTQTNYYQSPSTTSTFNSNPYQSSSSSLEAAAMVSTNSQPATDKSHICPNCQKGFAREDLLKRHMSREARAAQQPIYERQKSCKECSRSKARCDLEVPTCGRCKSKGKVCEYAARSGNPNMRKQIDAQDNAGPPAAPTPSGSSGSYPPSRQASGTYDNAGGPLNQSWPPQFHSDSSIKSETEGEPFADGRNYSTGSASSMESGNPHLNHPEQPRLPPTPYYQINQGYTSSYQHQQRGPAPYQQAHLPAPYRAQPGLGPGMEGSYAHPPPLPMRLPVPTQHHNRPDITMSMAPHLWSEEEAPSPSSLNPTSFSTDLSRQPPAGSSRQMPPPLLTGARMPGPPSGIVRPSLFTASLDLSGWLDEPVVPSPLYRMGPSFNSLGSALGSAFPQFSARPIEGRNELPQSEENGASQPSQQLQIFGPGGQPLDTAPIMISARHWWSQTTQSTAPEGAETLASISAAHFKTYPALMVLPDPTSPVPPFINRSWIAQLRALMPRSLAVARVVLAGYMVRLPPSEGMVWESLAKEARALIEGMDRTLESTDQEVWAATASLWLYLVLMMMSDDTSASPYVDATLVDSALHTLSQLAKQLAERVQNQEEMLKPDGRTGTSQREETFFTWGCLETMRRTLFAAYVLLVLQRYRENALNIQLSLAGFELILDCQLPASANQFEAGTDQEWRQARKKEVEDSEKLNVNGNGDSSSVKPEDSSQLNDRGKMAEKPVKLSYPTMRDLISARGDLENSSKTLSAYFDQTDSFTNICLTIAFALDADLASADSNSLRTSK